MTDTQTIQPPRSDRYNPQSIEPKWRKKWLEGKLYTFTEDSSKPKYYAFTMFPYPSGNLHIGHWYSAAIPDARARYMRMKGKNVFFPMGFDSFGLPAENAAIKRGINPKIWTRQNIEHMTGQFDNMGTMIDWNSRVVTSDPEYYRWNQWFFVQFFKRGLAYKKESFVNWDPVDNTVLANEQVIDGRGERSGAIVEKRLMSQWNLKITDYAEELLNFDGLDWPERVKLMQTNWIGKSKGAEIDFASSSGPITVFTTRPDTVYGATFMVLAPEHALVKRLTSSKQFEAVNAYIEKAKLESEIERTAEGREKTGVWLGSYATNPVTNEPIPIWIADYVMATYGTGSIMAVPFGDARDFEFARKFNLPIRVIARAEDGTEFDSSSMEMAYDGPGILVNSGVLDGMKAGKEFINESIAALEGVGVARAKITYRLRDWLISRQRYWGTPIPITYCEKCGAVPVPEDQLPVILPDDVEFLPTGQSPLKLHPTWKNTVCSSCGGPAERDTDTMDTFVDSSWYFMRYLDPHNSESAINAEKVNRMLPADVYSGGIEHAILHLLYARFWTKAARDIGLIHFGEFAQTLRNQGMILGEDGEKMSKRRGNVVDPDNLVAEYGTDTVRLYLMFLAPWEMGGPWNSSGITGPYKWLGRVWSLYFDETSPNEPLESVTEKEVRFAVHSALKKVGEDLERFSFNTAIPAMMELTNTLGRAKRTKGMLEKLVWTEALEILVKILAPFAPHISEEIWSHTSSTGTSIHLESWPTVDESALTRDELEIVIQVNGKLRGKMTVSSSAGKEDILAAAKVAENVGRFLEGFEVIKEVYVPGKLVNIVVKG